MISYQKINGAGLIALASVLFFVLILPEYQVIGEARKEIAEREEELRQRTVFANQIKEWAEKIEARQEDLEKLTILLPTEKKVQEVLVGLEEITRQTGVQITEIKTGSESLKRNESLKVLLVDLDAVGSYSALVNFLRQLEKNLRIFDVQSLTLSPVNGEQLADNTGLLFLSVKFNAYFLK